MFFDDIGTLVKETMNNSEGLNKNPFIDFSFGGNHIAPDQVPGVFYHLEKKASTFVIRIYPSRDLSVDYPLILESPDKYSGLRLLSDDDIAIKDKLQYFECDLYELALGIKAELSNKRFPFFEEHIFNISDPGDSWWIKTAPDELKVFFKLSRTESMDTMVKLGPLGDTQLAQEKFHKLYGYFKMLFPIADYSSAHGVFQIKSEGENSQFKAFMKIFTEGDSGFDFWDALRKLEMDSMDKPYIESLREANFFLMELANIRRFWICIQSQLDD